MSDGSLKALKQNLESFNSELGLTLEQEKELNTYNELFLNKLSSNIQNVLDLEIASLDKINNISNTIDDYKEHTLDKIEDAIVYNSVKYDEKYSLNRDAFDIERKKISKEMDENNSNFDKQLEDINFTTYRRNLGIVQTSSDYVSYSKNISNIYVKSLDFLYRKKDIKQIQVSIDKERSKKRLKHQLDGFKFSYEEETSKLEEVKLQQDLIANKNLSEQEKILFQHKIDLNESLGKISSSFIESTKEDSIPYSTHIQYLTTELERLKHETLDEEVVFLEKFKLNLEALDKQIEINKNTHLESIEKIQESTTTQNTKNKEIKRLESNYKVFQEKMRRKKIEYDIDKNYQINKLNLLYDYEVDLIKKQITFFEQQMKNIEVINSNKELTKVIELRTEMELNELNIKHSIDVIKQSKSFNEMRNKLNKEYITNTYYKQIELYNSNVEIKDKYYKIFLDNISILTSLEIEKNLILKKYNQNLNELLQQYNSHSSSIIKKDEEFEIKLKKLKHDFINKNLAQDIQYANKKQELNKMILTLEKEYDETKLTADHNYQLDLKINKIFENRFKIEKKLYNLYFSTINNQNDFILEYFNRFFIITKCKKDNVSFAIFEHLSKYVNHNINSLMDKTIDVVNARITFEGTVNFEYELNRLVTQKEQNELIFTISLQKMIETIDNYSKTISLYEDKINTIQKESDKINNIIILRDLESKNNSLGNKSQQETLLLKETLQDYKKDIKSYQILITKNKKLIVEINKSITRLKSKHNITEQKITNEIDTIEKKHKNESSVYLTFVEQIEELKQEFTNLKIIKDNEENAFKYFRKHTFEISSRVNKFIESNIENLFDQLGIRQQKTLLIYEEKNKERISNAKLLLQQDIKRLSYSYNDDIFEIEKRVDKLYSTYKYKKKELIIEHKEIIQDIKHKQKEIEVMKRQSKAKLFYDVNTFTENINNHDSINSKMIDDIAQKSKTLLKEFDKSKETYNEERKNKISYLFEEHKNINKSFKKDLQYSLSLKTKENINKKKRSEKSVSLIYNNNQKIDNIYKKFVEIRKKELDQSIKLLTLEYKNDFNILNKKSESKINKQTKKFNKENN